MGKILLAVLVFAVVTYLLVRLIQNLSDRRRGGGGSTAQRPRRPRGPQPPQIIPPDDDTDFLRDLERKKKRDDKPEKP